MSRPRCSHCLRPQSHCLCAHIQPCHNQHPVLIMQHSSEQQHAKGTALLAYQALAKAELIIGESPDDFQQLKQRVLSQPEAFALIYPSPLSQAIENQVTRLDRIVTADKPLQLIFLDGTWRKAKKLWHLNPWLQHLTQFHFETPPEGQYVIRKTSVDKGLSTIEAIAYSLQVLENLDSQPLLKALAALKQQQLAAIPEGYRHRYNKQKATSS
ncbi:tRNA-uridine aminocarboxypropyltransferase [Agarivorans sp.]|uniref:tRNA-uridine aminocarboxypropyltransferase n=1 Tax=Agarivorans sp. TaxID=1872412 RepID=UPI003D05B718